MVPRDEALAHTGLGRAAAEEVAAAVHEAGGTAELIAGDLADAEVPGHLVAANAPIEVLVNNAVNVHAPALLMRASVEHHRDRQATLGRIVNVSPDSARASAGQSGYGASKAALKALTRSAAIELGPLGITVNAVAPGPVPTGDITPELEQQLLPWIPLGRVGTPDDVLDGVVFFASAQAGYITGHVLQVASGHAL
jgi:3-oxoacyl-[acyl-carrier protein] reductase